MLGHSRTPREVVMVLVICYLAIPPVYTHVKNKGCPSYCPYRHFINEETQILEASVVEVEARPISVVNLRTATYTTATTLTGISYTSRTITVHRPNVQVIHTVLLTPPEHITQTKVLTVPWTITITTTVLTTTTATRLLHTTTILVPSVTSYSTVVLEQPVTSRTSIVSYVTPVETAMRLLTKTVTTSVVGSAPATPSTYTITDTIIFTVCLPKIPL